METQYDKIFEQSDTILFADETKFAVNNGDIEDAIFYFGVSAPKSSVAIINREFDAVLSKHNYQGSTFHATNIFREKRPRFAMMQEITDLIIKYRLPSFSYKYLKSDLFELTQVLTRLNNDILNFSNQEFQALFYYLLSLNTYLRDNAPKMLGKNFVMYFDRNVYGSAETEAFNFPDTRFVIRRMTFSAKSSISLLSLPDFFGYIFRKAKLSMDKVNANKEHIETSKLTINCYSMLLKLQEAKLLHFLNVKDEAKVIRQMFNIIL